ncbi:peptidoglycan/LPS O-acetylase OafA/YrhL [Dyadobacter jejuensis]|uniref:Peptidoglycan/LPS O-acetylase OafA/YrhL n=1 Tax=Dyadobacter jejuensis TaxID=1082580 RepID=A0A316AS10_9BACT|nr:acyltransferase [Dyadobacter jejuensis]PWJ60054.1 peptidoglycan/LPS O-acetylase OafA/YrhL [Dyadobacter jejuensis]
MDRSIHHRFFELDVLRGMAALAVALFHLTINENTEKLGWQFRYGVTGVDIFFMISGFVIYMSLNKVQKPGDFLVFRFARLYPAYWMCVLLTAIFILVYEPAHFSLAQILANLTMFPIYFGVENLDGSYWTLLVELCFYIWIFILLFRRSMRSILYHGAIFTLLIVGFHLFRNSYPSLYQYIQLKLELINHFPLFFSGIVFYHIWTQGYNTKYIIYLLFCFGVACYLHDKGGRSMFFVSLWEHISILLVYFLIFALVVSNKLIFIVKSPLVYLGNISYALYLLHQYIGTHLVRTLNETYSWSIEWAIITVLSVCIGLAAMVHHLVEVPGKALVLKWYKRESPAVKQFA